MLTCRIIGILQIEQKSKGKAERNDRLFAVPRRPRAEQGLRGVRDLSKQVQQEVEKLFIATDELEDKKLEGTSNNDDFFVELIAGASATAVLPHNLS